MQEAGAETAAPRALAPLLVKKGNMERTCAKQPALTLETYCWEEGMVNWRLKVVGQPMSVAALYQNAANRWMRVSRNAHGDQCVGMWFVAIANSACELWHSGAVGCSTVSS